MAGGGEVEVHGSKSPVKIMANIFISFIGAGVLGLPFAFKEVGDAPCCVMESCKIAFLAYAFRKCTHIKLYESC